MELANDISGFHRIILELASATEAITPQLAGYIQQFEAQRCQIDLLEPRLKELAPQIDRNSRNSSRPLSSDMYRQKPAFPRVKGDLRLRRYRNLSEQKSANQ
jgi:hypothetical protein